VERCVKTRVLLADDHTVVRYGLRALFELAGMTVVGEASEGREALRLAMELEPDAAVLDVTMPGLNGIDATAELQQRCPEVRVVILSMHADSEHVHRAFAAGASAYLLKGSAGSEIVDAVRSVCAGGRYLSRELAHLDQGEVMAGDAPTPLDRLSARERQVLQLVVEGHSSASIATIVNLSPKSVDTYRSRLMRKLGVTDLPGLVKFAVQHGLTPGA
jgi:DNA-binding NarL/FixJ family response regulator